MGFFSFFSKSHVPLEEINIGSDYSEYFTKELFSEIVDQSSTMMLYFTKKDSWIGANERFYETFNLKNITDFHSKYESVRDLFLSESEEIFTEDDKSWLDYIKKYKSKGYTLTVSTKDNGIITVNAKCYTFSKSQYFYILELDDISELYQAQLKTREVEKLKTKFLTNIGHEFRTPMNGILGFIELINETELTKAQKEYLHMINSSSRNLMANIETLLDLSKMQGGKLKLEKESFEILPEMEKLAYSFCTLGGNKGVKVLSFIDPKLPKLLNGDIRKIKQVMNSLVQNSIKSTPKYGRIFIEVKLLKRETNGDCSIGFRIKDNGKGIAREKIALITEPFSVANYVGDSLEVSLSLSHGLVNLMGSNLQIQSEEEHGSHFNFVLNFKASVGQSYKMMPKKKVRVLLLDKLKIDEANFLTTYLRSFAIDVIKSNTLDEHVYQDVNALYVIAPQSDFSWMLKLNTYKKQVPLVLFLDEEERVEHKFIHIIDEVVRKPLLPSFIAKHLRTLYKNFDNTTQVKESKLHLRDKIVALVVEDNLINQRLIQILLEEYKIFVSTASNGVEGVDMASKNRYDIIFMDIDMPEKDGVTATKEIKMGLSTNVKTPIVALTAMALEGDKKMLLSEGLDDYMSKPLSRAKLELILNKYLKVRV